LTNDPLVPLLDPDAVAEAAAEIFVATARAAARERGAFVACLCGGTTPRILYELLAGPPYSGQVPWDRTDVLFGDERSVPHDHPDSNFRMASEALLDHVRLPRDQIHPIPGSNPELAAASYEQELRELYAGQPWPGFDLLLLGVGTDGHTASLFPGTAALDETTRWVVGNYVPQLASWRVTLTLPALCHAQLILFLVTGEEKAPVVAEAFGGRPHAGTYPCERVLPVRGRREILLDRAAAKLL
jgi:6-phosphogluconolactonase